MIGLYWFEFEPISEGDVLLGNKFHIMTTFVFATVILFPDVQRGKERLVTIDRIPFRNVVYAMDVTD